MSVIIRRLEVREHPVRDRVAVAGQVVPIASDRAAVSDAEAAVTLRRCTRLASPVGARWPVGPVWVVPAARDDRQEGRGSEVAISLRTTCRCQPIAISRDLNARWLWRLPAIRLAARSPNPAATAMHADFRRAVAAWVEQLHSDRARGGARAESNPSDAHRVTGAPLPDVVGRIRVRGRPARSGGLA